MIHPFPTRRSSDLHEAGRGERCHHPRVSEDGPPGGGGDQCRHDAERGQQHYVDLRVPEDPEQVLPEDGVAAPPRVEEREVERSEEHTSELQSLMRISYAVFCLKKKKKQHTP